MDLPKSQDSAAGKGMLWSGFERLSVQGLQFLFQIILARLLGPSDYGTIALLAVFMTIAQTFIDSGFTNALIKKANRTDVDFSTVFYFNIVISLVMYALLFFLAPAISALYKAPELTDIVRVYALSLPITALGAIQRTQYTININFKKQAFASAVGALCGGVVGIAFALMNFGAWSLVYLSLATNSVTTVLLWLRNPWKPKGFISRSALHSMFSFGSKLLLSGLLDTTYKNLYLLVIGKIFSKQDLGYYSRADQFAIFPSSNITGIMQRVTYPLLCNIENNTPSFLVKSYRKYIRLAAYIIFPLMIGLAAIAKPFIGIFLGQKWLFTADLLRIICFADMLYPIHAINLNVLLVKGRSDLFLKVGIIKMILGISILAMVAGFPITIMACGNIVASLIALYINTYYTKKFIGYGIFEQLIDIFPFFLLSIISCAPAFLISGLFPASIPAMLLSIMLAIGLYVLLSCLKNVDEFKTISSEIRSIIRSRGIGGK